MAIQRSPYLLAALGLGQGGANIDPAAAGSYGKLGLAQELMQAGMDSSPAYPMQGIGRLAQALAGNYLLYSGNQELQDYGKAKNAASDAVFNRPLDLGGSSASPAASEQGPAVPVAARPMPQQFAQWQPLIEKTAAETGVPVRYISGMLARETNGNPNAVNPTSGATGLAQALASTAANPGYGVPPISQDDLRNPEKAIPWAGQYLAGRAKAQGADWNNPDQAAKALSAYGGDSTGEYGRTLVAQAGGGGVPIAQGPTSGAAAAPSGLNSPQVKAIMDRIGEINALVGRYPNDTGLHARAKMEMDKLGLMLGIVTKAPQATHTITLQDPGSQTSSIYEQLPGGQLGKRIGQAPASTAPHTITMQDPDGKQVGIYEILPGNQIGKRLGQAPKQPLDEDANPFGKGQTALAAKHLQLIAPRILDGTATPDQQELFRMSGDIYSNGSYDPATGRSVPGLPFTPQMQAAFDRLKAQTAPGATPAPSVPSVPAPPPQVPPPTPTPAPPSAALPVPPIPPDVAPPAAVPGVPPVPPPAVVPPVPVVPPAPPAPPVAANPLAQPPVTQTTPTGSLRIAQAPMSTPAALDAYRTAEAETGKVVDAVNAFMTELRAQGGTGLNTFLDNPLAPKAIRLNQLHNRLQEAMRGEAFMNTGVLQPAEMEMLKARLLDPRSIRGWMATNDSFQEMTNVLNDTVQSGLARKRALAGLPALPSPSGQGRPEGATVPQRTEAPAAAPSIQEGTTIVNRATGKRKVWRGDDWVDLP